LKAPVKSFKFKETAFKVMSDEDFDSESSVDYDDSEDVRSFLTHNLKEGYLSDDEQLFVDKLVTKLESYQRNSEIQEVVKQIQLNKSGEIFK